MNAPMSTFDEGSKKTIETLYLGGFSAYEVAEQTSLTSARNIQRYLKHRGLIRSRKDAFRLAIENGRMTYDQYRVDKKTKERRKTINPALRYRVFKRDGFCCQVCGGSVSTGAKLQVDHIVQLVDGGTNKESNLQTLCSECNIGKYHEGKSI